MTDPDWIPVVRSCGPMWQCPDCGKLVVRFQRFGSACPYDFCPFCLRCRAKEACEK